MLLKLDSGLRVIELNTALQPMALVLCSNIQGEPYRHQQATKR